MSLESTHVYPVVWQDDHVLLIDQNRLPNEYALVAIHYYQDMAEAIKTMIVRGAPAIGVAAAYGVYLGARDIKSIERDSFLTELEAVAECLRATRPTAVNLFWAIERMMKIARQTAGPIDFVKQVLLKEAQSINAEDLQTCRAIGDHGVEALPTSPQRLRLLTYCNAGALATAGYGTALGVVRSAWQQERLERVYSCETRPRFQGARLTTWECVQDEIPVTLITDNMVAHCMRRGMVDAVVVGADRIAANGDSANKIGTYMVALVAKAHQIPFFVAAPLSTVDFSLPDGVHIPIEERDPDEVRRVGSTVLCLPEVAIYNPAFDVTPADLITAIITEHGAIVPGELKQLEGKQIR